MSIRRGGNLAGETGQTESGSPQGGGRPGRFFDIFLSCLYNSEMPYEASGNHMETASMIRRLEYRRIYRRLIALVCAALMLCATVSAGADDGEIMSYEPDTNSISGWPVKNPVYGQSCVLVDAETGAVLCALEKDTKRYPASTTKCMTCLLALENLSLDGTVTMTEEGCRGVAEDSSNAGTVVGEEFSVEDCLYMLMLKSANDIANQLAIEVGGDVESFAEIMTERARLLGCTGTHFHNSSGMPDDEHYTTAMDLALIFREALKNDMFRKLISTLNYTVGPTNRYDGERSYQNHNSLINPDSEYYYEYCIGGKTGFTNAAQRTLVSAAEKDGWTLICVTMKTPDKTDYSDQARLYTYGFDNFKKTGVPGGAVVLPNGVDTSPFLDLSNGGSSPNPLYTAEIGDRDGKRHIQYLYSGLPVGRAVVDIPVESVAESAEEIPAGDALGAAGSEKNGSGVVGARRAGSPLLPIIALIILLAAALLFAGSRYRKELEKKRAEQRRRYQARRKKENSGFREAEAEEIEIRRKRSGSAEDRKDGGENRETPDDTE